MARIDDGIASLGRRSVWARSLLGLFILVYALNLIWAVYILYREMSTGFGLGYITIAPILTLPGAGAFTLSMIAFLFWLHRAHANLLQSGITDMGQTPGWAVTSYFVPIVNLFVPFRAMRELWNRSHGEDVYQSTLAVPDVSAWWSCFIAGCLVQGWLILTTAFNVLTNLEIINPPGVNSGLGVAAIGLMLGSAIYLFRIIVAITRAQQSMTGVEQAFA